MNATRAIRQSAIVIAIIAGCALGWTATAKDHKTYFTGTECFGDFLDMGVWTELGNGKIRITDLQSWHIDTASDSRLSGIDYVVINAMLDPVTNSGHAWGAFQVVNDQGSWSGHFVATVSNGNWYIDGLLHGIGAYDGLVANWSYRPNPDPEECSLISGYIVETGAGR